ncbi:MAG: outer membrane lipoprotein carrier protein LolA [Spirochaetia bacterium]|nr:outer membrane lipoprotein carrier protein LolA [Spirochaetia bacterium]MBQ3713208.1 outer membrane lipoprotein carrier protein LolA [Spirochaetia bacterium]
MNKLLYVKKLFIICLIIFPVIFAYSQEQARIVTANEFLNFVSAQYGSIDDYEAKVVITKGKEKMDGTIYYKTPSLLRINFDNPKEQVLVVDKEKLVIYIPKYRVIMQQKLKKKSGVSGAGMANKEGLKILKQNYIVSYLESPDLVPLDEGSEEMVIKLKFVWRTADEGFRQLIMSVGEDNLIRRMVCVTADYTEMQFDFTDIKTNEGIPDTRFEYDSPASANVFENFLFEAE